MNEQQRDRLLIWRLREELTPPSVWQLMQHYGPAWPLLWLYAWMGQRMVRPALWIVKHFRK